MGNQLCLNLDLKNSQKLMTRISNSIGILNCDAGEDMSPIIQWTWLRDSLNLPNLLYSTRTLLKLDKNLFTGKLTKFSKQNVSIQPIVLLDCEFFLTF